ncbi:MAG: histone H1-like repetitive region-containing protein [Acidimicrobiia bacterium]|nr:histone H1-like repetitive region-containing protein [Acidimicrobiia bacterium]
MAQSNNVLKRYLDAGMAFTAITQTKAEELVKDLVRSGEVQTEQAQTVVVDLVERSRKNTEAFIEQVRQDISSSAEALGLATIADLTRVERLIESIRSNPVRPVTRARKAVAKRAPAKKAVAATKTTATKASAKKTTAKKAVAKKAVAKKTAATKTAS